MAEIQRRVGKVESFKEGEFVYVWLPPETRTGKLGPRWEGPFKIDKALGGARYQVGDRVEHSYNMKRAHLSVNPGGQTVVLDNGDLDDYNIWMPNEDSRPKRKMSTESSESVEEPNNDSPKASRVQPTRQAKKVRLAAVLQYRPKGDLLWLQ
jgi:hypothetical protein